MSRVITFSRYFPAHHPKAGQPTFFVEKIHQWIWDSFDLPYYSLNEMLYQVNKERTCEEIDEFVESIDKDTIHIHKQHTIRALKRPYKVGDKFSPRVWMGKPYNSKQIVIAPDIEVKKVWEFEMDLNGIYSINGKYIHEDIDDNGVSENTEKFAMNDGLTSFDMQFWFMPNMDKPKEFKGQIICWNENINY